MRWHATQSVLACLAAMWALPLAMRSSAAVNVTGFRGTPWRIASGVIDDPGREEKAT